MKNKTIFRIEFVTVSVSDYNKIANNFEDDKNIDSELGLKFAHTNRYVMSKPDYVFQIVNEKKWMLAKIKYGF
jgi:hypothetical protein